MLQRFMGQENQQWAFTKWKKSKSFTIVLGLLLTLEAHRWFCFFNESSQYKHISSSEHCASKWL